MVSWCCVIICITLGILMHWVACYKCHTDQTGMGRYWQGNEPVFHKALCGTSYHSSNAYPHIEGAYLWMHGLWMHGNLYREILTNLTPCRLGHTPPQSDLAVTVSPEESRDSTFTILVSVLMITVLDKNKTVQDTWHLMRCINSWLISNDFVT